MAENQDFKNLFDTLSRASYLQGTAIQKELEALGTSIRTDMNGKIAALAGEDQKINQTLEMFRKITDAEPGTPEWDEGKNLYTLISERYVALAKKADDNTVAINELKSFAETLTADVKSYNENLIARVDQEIIDRKAAVAALQTEVDDTKSKIAAANKARTDALASIDQKMKAESQARTEKDEAQQAEINNLRTRVADSEADIVILTQKEAALREDMTAANDEINTLKTKQVDLIARVEKLESYFTGLGDGTELANELMRGLKGQSSAYGHSAA